MLESGCGATSRKARLADVYLAHPTTLDRLKLQQRGHELLEVAGIQRVNGASLRVNGASLEEGRIPEHCRPDLTRALLPPISERQTRRQSPL